MTKQQRIDNLNSAKLPFLVDMKGRVVDIDIEKGTCEMTFDISERYCHSVNVIQGGFVTTMLDSVSSHAVFGSRDKVISVATLELKVTYYKPSFAGKFKAVGRIEKMGRSIVFSSGDLYNSDGVRTASITQTAKIIYAKEEK